LVEGVFYAKIVCEKDGDVVEIDARTSDAIAVGIRAGCPVYTFEHILSSAGIQLEDEIEAEGPAQEEMVEEAKETNELKAASPEELEAMLQDAIDREDYERASEIRDELNKRN
jgi:bifunctional DNase/RNase